MQKNLNHFTLTSKNIYNFLQNEDVQASHKKNV